MATRRDSVSTSHSLFLRYWLPVLGYVVLISILSHQPRLQPPIIPFFPSDKAAHLIEYFLLGLLLARAWRATLGRPRPMVLAVVAISGGVLMGTLDEIHQSFVPGRDSSAYDLFADSAGATLAQLLILARTRS